MLISPLESLKYLPSSISLKNFLNETLSTSFGKFISFITLPYKKRNVLSKSLVYFRTRVHSVDDYPTHLSRSLYSKQVVHGNVFVSTVWQKDNRYENFK